MSILKKNSIFSIFSLKNWFNREYNDKKRIIFSLSLGLLLSFSHNSVAAYTVRAPQDILQDVSQTDYSEIYSFDPKTVSLEDRGKNYSWGFKREQGKAPYITDDILQLFSENDAFYLGNEAEKVLYLTFDEGYENGFTAPILDTLKQHNVPAAFFITGSYFNKEKELIKRMLDEGHVVGNHTLSHPSMPKVLDDNKLKNEITFLSDKFKEEFGVDMKFIRPPMGEFSRRTLKISKELGYKTVFWSSAYVDWNVKDQPDRDYAFKAVTDQFHNGSVILLHAVSSTNSEILGDVIAEAKRLGFEFKSLNDFL